MVSLTLLILIFMVLILKLTMSPQDLVVTYVVLSLKRDGDPTLMNKKLNSLLIPALKLSSTEMLELMKLFKLLLLIEMESALKLLMISSQSGTIKVM